MHGRGVFQWADGRTYDGEYCEDQKQGGGIFKVVTTNTNKCFPQHV